MAQKLADSQSLGFFCDSLSSMLAAGIQTDEALHILADDAQGDENATFRRTCQQVYREVIQGKPLARAMSLTGAFPPYAVNMIAVGERSGKLEATLRSLGAYYAEETRMFAKIKSSLGYPAALFCIMTIILAFTVGLILPVFVNVYESLAGSLTAGSFSLVAVAIGIGWVALAVTFIVTVIALVGVAFTRTPRGRERIMSLCEKLPATKSVMYELALSRLVAALAAYTASGMNSDDALRDSLQAVSHRGLRQIAEQALSMMIDLDNPRSLVQAMAETHMLDTAHVRMLAIGTRTGSLESVLGALSDELFDDAMDNMDHAVDVIEPSLAAFLTIAVGATLVSVMLPLIGIMGSIS